MGNGCNGNGKLNKTQNQSRKMKKIAILSLLVAGFALACKRGTPLTELDLIKYGIPVKIQAPKEAKVVNNDLEGLMQDVTIQKEDFDIQIIGMDAIYPDAKTAKEAKLSEVKADPAFSKLIKDEENGFIYEIKLDTLAYNFYNVRIAGDKMYEIQAGFTAKPTLEQATMMYDAVK